MTTSITDNLKKEINTHYNNKLFKIKYYVQMLGMIYEKDSNISCNQIIEVIK